MKKQKTKRQGLGPGKRKFISIRIAAGDNLLKWEEMAHKKRLPIGTWIKWIIAESLEREMAEKDPF